jgi:hypothetical protein
MLRCLPLILTTGLLLAPAGTVQAESSDSCLIANKAIGLISTDASREAANDTYSVLRPCKGRVKSGRATVLYGVGDGVSRTLTVAEGDYIEQKLGAHLGPGKKLADIWPKRTILVALRGLMAGERPALKGLSGFEGQGQGNTLPLTGSLLMLEGMQLPLAIHGLDPGQAIRLVQGNKSVSFAPEGGHAKLSFKNLAAGLASIEQGPHKVSVKLVPLSEEADLNADLAALAQSGEEPDALQLRRAILLQDAQYPVNAVAEYLKGKKL